MSIFLLTPLVAFVVFKFARMRRYAGARNRTVRFASDTRRSRWSNRGGF